MEGELEAERGAMLLVNVEEVLVQAGVVDGRERAESAQHAEPTLHLALDAALEEAVELAEQPVGRHRRFHL